MLIPCFCTGVSCPQVRRMQEGLQDVAERWHKLFGSLALEEVALKCRVRHVCGQLWPAMFVANIEAIICSICM